ncbi:rRNA maturation RNase YbeY [Polaribacter glomeratus]|uniref:Endoribonuclease YbeY n=1 Tax=Polaribacter glomeratus TaxID=102 RepID=A0A2S7WH79_9FLAO|nr:rRNA maturation RNase YbeY [Polaribacter glomeratus]PQJ76776.1 rRNA maturation RNase YbeY [Polaribacter glomeratus]TXD67383.1 rRNA maturation RNase YbeY [Polaribacter glomeratus]
MVEFNYETTFQLEDENRLEKWIENVASNNGYEVGEINYIFCDDEYLLKLNVEFLKHDTLTDVISFDNTLGKLLNGDIFISIERVLENAKEYNDSFEDELHRVMVHGVLHYMGFKDKLDAEIKQMRTAENSALLLLNN